MTQTMRGTTIAVAEWVAGLGHDDVPDATRRVIRSHLLDTLGCGLYGRSTEWTGIVERWARAQGEAGGGRARLASVWGDEGPSLRLMDAALVNGIAAHAFELDDYHTVKIHPGAVVVPAAMAAAERLDSSGTELATAIAAGFEVMVRTSAALDPSSARLRGWHLTGVTGTLGAAAAVSVLMELDAERTTWALGIAGTQSSGLFAFNADGAMTKRFHAGRAAQAGLMAAELAQAGFTGPTQIYEAEDGGFLRAFSDASRADPLTDGLGKTWLADGSCFKPYSCCGSLHSYLDAAIELRGKLGEPAGRRVRAGLAKVVEVQCGFDYRASTQLNAQMSARFCIATALIAGRALPGEFAEDRLADSETCALAERIELVHDPELDSIYPGRFVGWVEMEREAGAFERAYHLDPSGSPANPAKETAMREKFRELMAEIMPADRTERIEACVDAIEGHSARELVSALAEPARAAAE